MWNNFHPYRFIIHIQHVSKISGRNTGDRNEQIQCRNVGAVMPR